MVEQSTITMEKDINCEECGRAIKPGEQIHYVYGQQYEECFNCEMGYCECSHSVNDLDQWVCQCEKPNFGETYDYYRCMDCDKFLAAVEAAEVEAGCARHEARPGMGAMTEDINGGGRDEAKKYWRKAVTMFPELKASGYLGRLWAMTF